MLTRRVFLKGGGLSLLAFGAGPTFLQRAALASSTRRRKVLVTIFQRGAMDGLMAVAPTGGSALASYRPRLGMSAARAPRSGVEGGLIDLGVGYALHPAFGGLKPLWNEKRLAIVHAVGSPDPTRSHFDAQDYMESGTPGRKGTPSGWLNRAVGLLGHDATPFRAVALTPALPRSLYGDAAALAVTNLADFKVRLPGAEGTARDAAGGFESLYAHAAAAAAAPEQTSATLLRDSGAEAFDAIRLLSDAHLASYRPAPGAEYPASPLGQALRQIAQLVKADVGLEIAFAESAGWDTHVQQGTATGSFARRARDLGDAVAAFWTDLGARQSEVVLMTMTEFGRTVRENGSGGTDHGHGSCLFVLGDAVDGGKVHGRLDSLAAEALYEGRDLPVTTDFRAVFSEVAGRHLGIAARQQLFPGWSGESIPLLRS